MNCIIPIIKSKIVFCAILLCSLSSFSQELSYKVNLEDQVKLSDQIVEGKIIAKSSFWDDTYENIYTRQTIEVYKVFKGNIVETVDLITEGGIVGLEAVMVSHSLQLQEGDTGVFMLKRADSQNLSKGNTHNNFESVSDFQGFYKYDKARDRVANAFETHKGIQSNFQNILSNYTLKKPIQVKSDLLLQDDISRDEETPVYGKSSSTTAALAVTSFSATSFTAGTKSVLTINGSGFGQSKGAVGFSDANYGGYLHTDALDNQILSWSDNKIEVEIPDNAGSGTIKVSTASGGSIVTTEKLHIDFAQINLEYNSGSGKIAYQTQHIDDNSEGGNTWIMNTNFSATGAKEAFARAFESWTCGSGINWEISASTTPINTNADDGVNVITFVDNLGTGTLGKCYSRYSGCSQDGEIKWYVKEMDIIFNSNIDWNFSTNPPTNGQVDFETVTVHELGHGHQLGHVVDTNVVMHYSISKEESLRALQDNDLMGAKDVLSRSTSTAVCNQLSMTESSCSLLSSKAHDYIEDIVLYPNPVKDVLFIKNPKNYQIQSMAIYDIQGKQIRTINFNSNAISNRVNLNKLSAGIYFLSLKVNNTMIKRKLIVNQ
ncbi:T9SS type A sorting domain-containing protein [Gaetbulibacter saemankumensis]|uniref:T9SS type A sorting domain-containing protein n=1 Tax=Gaetbulibacter saemankumensis TaxID=311208 RepID=UPI00040795EB|nr:T9SS type A sorting domain-containing protein [Gaetbulibacter saemankumensis]